MDGLALVGPSRFGTELPLSKLSSLSAENGVHAAYCAPAMPPSGDMEEANRYVSDLLGEHNDRETGLTCHLLCRIDPYVPNAIERTRAHLLDGAVGIFVHPWEQTVRVTDRRVIDPIFELAADLAAPVILEAGFPWVSEPAQVGEVARRYPDVQIVASRGNQMNMSGLATEEAAAVLAAHENLHYLTAGVYRQDWLIDIVHSNPDQVLFGSLWPLFDLQLELMRISELTLDSDIRRKVTAENAQRIYGAGRG